MPVPPALKSIGAVAEAIKEGFKVLGQWLSGKEIRKLKYRVEAATSFVHVVFGEGEWKEKGFKNLYDQATTEQKKHMTHFRKRIFDI